MRIEENCYHSNSSEKPSADADVKKPKRGKNNKSLIQGSILYTNN